MFCMLIAMGWGGVVGILIAVAVAWVVARRNGLRPIVWLLEFFGRRVQPGPDPEPNPGPGPGPGPDESNPLPPASGVTAVVVYESKWVAGALATIIINKALRAMCRAANVALYFIDQHSEDENGNPSDFDAAVRAAKRKGPLPRLVLLREYNNGSSRRTRMAVWAMPDTAADVVTTIREFIVETKL